VIFNDRTADRESHTHAAGFGGEEGIEQPVRILGGDPDAAIGHTYDTQMHHRALQLIGDDWYDKVLQQRIQTRRAGRPEEIAFLVRQS
jgi:hypothetical protein